MEPKWLQWAKRVRALADTGLTYADNGYDRERYQELKELSTEMIAEASNLVDEEVENLFPRQPGYPTPKVDVRAVVFKGDKILMVQERADGKWALPGGWAEIGYTPGESAAKEVKEEAGLEVEPTRLLAVLDKQRHDHPPLLSYLYKLFIECKVETGELRSGVETKAVDFFSLASLPPLSTRRNTRQQLELMFEYKDNPQKLPQFD